MMSTAADGGRFPFTASQWQELEHQALVYKYIIYGIPIPPDLLFTINTSFNSSSATNLFLHHQPPHHSIGWKCFEMGFGRKIDPEPGRCRRTDGKKWRCSKEAYPDSKYCERHMHRGRNRSRKPVELNNSTPPTNPKSPNYPCTPNSDYHHNSSNFLYPHHHNNLSSSTRPNLLSSQAPHHPLKESSPCSHSDKDYNRYGMKDEHPFFSETSGSIKTMSDSWQLGPVAINHNINNNSKQRTFSDYQNGCPYLQLQNTPSKQQKQDHTYSFDHHHQLDKKDEPQKVMHHFFDEWPPNDDDSREDSSTTHLSISIPTSAHDFFLNHNDK